MDVLPCNVTAVRNVSLLPGVAIATRDNERWDCRGISCDRNITYEHMQSNWDLTHERKPLANVYKHSLACRF